AALALIEAEIGANDANAALAAADLLLERVPNHGRALYWRGRALAASGRSVEARSSLERAAQILDESAVYQARISQALSDL
ncbi:MAG: hypothetical protein M3R06_01635, partial [Chloroflexota bacterium]|nr:hypothetical protein [Chloroflexota bacterium]